MNKDKIDEELFATIKKDITLLPIDSIRPFAVFLVCPIFRIEKKTE